MNEQDQAIIEAENKIKQQGGGYLKTRLDGNLASDSDLRTGEYSMKMVQANNATKVDLDVLSNSASGGSGSPSIKEAIGYERDWDTKGRAKANTKLGQDIVDIHTQLQTNANQILQNSNEYNKQNTLSAYANNQTAEKSGWTGGYILDQNQQRQMLRDSLNAQLYSAVELQKYGYDTSLAAARLAYDANQIEYADKYYQDALNNAMALGNTTGNLLTPETQELLRMRKMAEDQNNTEVIEKIDKYFADNGISKTGTKTLAFLEAEATMMEKEREQLQGMYEALIEKIEDGSNPVTNPYMIDDEGRYLKDSIDFTNVNNIDEIMKYIGQGEDASVSPTNTQQAKQLANFQQSVCYTEEKGGVVKIYSMLPGAEKRMNAVVDKLGSTGSTGFSAAWNELGDEEKKLMMAYGKKQIKNFKETNGTPDEASIREMFSMFGIYDATVKKYGAEKTVGADGKEIDNWTEKNANKTQSSINGYTKATKMTDSFSVTGETVGWETDSNLVTLTLGSSKDVQRQIFVHLTGNLIDTNSDVYKNLTAAAGDNPGDGQVVKVNTSHGVVYYMHVDAGKKGKGWFKVSDKSYSKLKSAQIFENET